MHKRQHWEDVYYKVSSGIAVPQRGWFGVLYELMVGPLFAWRSDLALVAFWTLFALSELFDSSLDQFNLIFKVPIDVL